MNWKLIFQLSIFGLIMAFATISLIPEKIEPLFWLVIYLFCAYVIARVCTSKYFFNGFMVSVINCIWVTAVQIIFCVAYMKAHPDRSPANMHLPAAMFNHPREAMVMMAPVFAIAFGLVLGLFSFIASKIVRKNNVPAV